MTVVLPSGNATSQFGIWFGIIFAGFCSTVDRTNQQDKKDVMTHTEVNGVTSKQVYERPIIVTYDTQLLQRQLGPARANTTGHALDEEILFGEEY